MNILVDLIHYVTLWAAIGGVGAMLTYHTISLGTKAAHRHRTWQLADRIIRGQRKW
jgi:hypothetical protein